MALNFRHWNCGFLQLSAGSLSRLGMIVICYLMHATPAVFAQESRDTAKTDRVHIDHARVIIGETVDHHEYLYLSREVELSQDSVFLYCDSARVIDKREVAAYGNIIIQKGDSLQVFSDTLLYFADTRLADLLGEVALIHGGQQLWTTHLAYDMELNIARYDRPGQLLDSTTQLSSKSGVYWVDTKEALFIDSVVVIDPEFNLVTDSMRYNAETQLARFIAPTRIFQDDAVIYCENGYYDLVRRKALFAGNAEYINQEEHATADSMIYDGKLRTVSLTGNARYADGDRVATGDTIVYHEMSGETRVAGNAYFRDATRNVYSEVITYNRDTEQLGVRGRGTITEGSQILRADSIDFDQQSGLGFVRGNVMIRDTAAQTVMQSDMAEFVRENGLVKAFGRSRPVLKNIIDNDTLHVTADTLISYEIEDNRTGDTLRYLNAYHDVRIFRGSMQGLCDSLVFDGGDSVFTMLGSPVLWSDTTQFTADTIDLYVRNKVLDRVRLRTNALIISAVQETFYNQIRGKQVHAKLDSSRIRSMQVNGNAESIYYVQDDSQAFIGVNRVVASEIFFTFDQGNLDGIKFNTRPAGTMTPMGLADHTLFRLEGFIWRNEERPKDLADLY